MSKTLQSVVQSIASFFRWEKGDHTLLLSISTKVLGTTAGTYLAFHILATVFWPACVPSPMNCAKPPAWTALQNGRSSE